LTVLKCERGACGRRYARLVTQGGMQVDEQHPVGGQEKGA